MYSDLFFGLSLLTMWNLWTDQECVLLMPKHLCVWEMPSWLLAYIFYLFSLTEVRVRVCIALFFVFWVLTFCTYEFLRGWLISSRPNQLLSTNRLLLLIFSWTCCSKLLYFIPADTLSSLWLNYHQYMICLVTSRMLHSPILDGIVK